jgi:hypothetical protein
MSFIAEIFLSMFFEVVCYGIGRFLIPVLSLGTARAEHLKEFRYSQALVYSRRNGMIVFSDAVASLIGLLFLFALGVAAYFLHKL